MNLSNLEHLALQLPAPFVLVGDFNAPPPLPFGGNVRQDSRRHTSEFVLIIIVCTCYAMVNIQIGTPAITLILFRIHLFVILHLCLNLTGKFMVILVEVIASKGDEPSAEHWRLD